MSRSPEDRAPAGGQGAGRDPADGPPAGEWAASAARESADLLLLDGELVPPAEASISVLDRGLLYGESLFETLKVVDGCALPVAGACGPPRRRVRGAWVFPWISRRWSAGSGGC